MCVQFMKSRLENSTTEHILHKALTVPTIIHLDIQIIVNNLNFYQFKGFNFLWCMIQRLTVQTLVSVCCVLEQDTLSALPQSTQL